MITGEEISEALAGQILGGFFWAIIGFVIILVIGVYVYTSLAYMTIAKKLKYKYPWLAWIPIANMSMILQLGGFHWAWVFLILVPILGWIPLVVLQYIAMWRIYEKRNYPGILALIPLLSTVPALLLPASIFLLTFIQGINFFVLVASMIILGMVAWKDRNKKKK